ncbi:hypothetical protein ASF56_04570 [Methylobacterium sp. Leaf122]|nr:hypothetical protein [Methylobacterium sp. Leaf122]KQQ12444.1 hypothetical protein ASF56_04570 [Methylobacterium sp. Leaf122]
MRSDLNTPPTASSSEGRERVVKPWRRYAVTVRISDTVAYTETVSAPTPAAARYRRFLDVSDAWNELTFGRFLAMASVSLVAEPPDARAYDYIRRSYGLDVKHGDRIEIRDECASVNGRQGHVVHPSGHAHYVHVVLDGDDHEGLYHPNSVRPLAAPSLLPTGQGEKA